ncbi:hypothetical protein BRADI_3g46225v3 [Brachypodium distachyon]|uniref:Uncharacterized protein n=1 Tax=Brachypodium distachyon TaxID=15368 RepID=A0A2K2D3K3_BRADI|nr:hypothetical protein BRADI_3g46225v3 [Brachypodium distachyon]
MAPACSSPSRAGAAGRALLSRRPGPRSPGAPGACRGSSAAPHAAALAGPGCLSPAGRRSHWRRSRRRRCCLAGGIPASGT